MLTATGLSQHRRDYNDRVCFGRREMAQWTGTASIAKECDFNNERDTRNERPTVLCEVILKWNSTSRHSLGER